MKTEIINNYLATAATDSFILGYARNGKVFAAIVETMTAANLIELTYTDRSSSKTGHATESVRYRPNRKQIAFLEKIADRIVEICDLETLENTAKETRKNRGETFETLATATLGGTQIGKCNAKYNTQGDAEINGKQYQVKYNKATLTNLQVLTA